jgi:NAD(P)-dependent dehydrogenase (short-subunit alcohol dehydrogenase family)
MRQPPRRPQPDSISRKGIAMTGSLKDQTVLVVGRGSGLARAVVLAARDEGAQVVAAGRDQEALGAAYAGEPGVSTELVDLNDEASNGGSFVIFSGAAAAKIVVGTMAVAITNAAADTLARSLALELAPIRVNAISPGVIDSGAWDAFGPQGKADYFADISSRNPAGRIGTIEDIAQGVLFALTNTFLTGQTLHIDGGEPLT